MSPTSMMRAVIFALVLAFVAPHPARADDTQQAAAVVENFHNTLLGVMKQAQQLGYDGRYRELAPVIQKTFDVPLMTRIVVGPQWADWSAAQRQQVTDAFGKFITSTYARRFDGYGGESFVVQGEKPLASGILVMTQLVRPNDDPVSLNYVTRRNAAGQWQVVDIFLTGSISELATRRSEFSAVLERDGYDGLIKALAKASGAGTT